MTAGQQQLAEGQHRARVVLTAQQRGHPARAGRDDDGGAVQPLISQARGKKKGSETCPISDPGRQVGVPIRLVG